MRAFVFRWPRKGYEPVTKKKISGTTRGLVSRLGPGLITGASDDDPSGIGTYRGQRPADPEAKLCAR